MKKFIDRLRNKRNQKNRILDDSGVTLVELIVVMAIMAIMVGVAVGGISLINNGNVKKDYKNVVSMLEKLRMDSLSVDGNWMGTIKNTDGQYQIKIVKQDGTSERLSQSLGTRIKIFYGKNENALTELANGQEMVFIYSKKSGKCNSCKVNGTELVDEYGSTPLVIQVGAGNNTKNMKLYFMTGKLMSLY